MERGRIGAMRIGLVGCVKQKALVAAPAAELYVSPLFRARRTDVERSCDRWSNRQGPAARQWMDAGLHVDRVDMVARRLRLT